MIEAVFQVVCDGWCQKILGRYGDGSYEAVHFWDDAVLSFHVWSSADAARSEAGWIHQEDLVLCPDCQLTMKS